jgi:hypothetical protein
MRKSSFIAAIVAGALLTSAACAETFSTSALNPSPVPANGVISGSYPQGGAEATYYFAADLKAGELATQISFIGRAGRDKSLEIVLVDPAGRRAGGHYVMGSVDANQEQARVLPVDATGRHVIRVTAKGPETTTFRIELGGTALANAQKVVNADTPFSRSFLAPTSVPADGIIAGKFPTSEKDVTTHYYFAANLKAGKLLSQLSFAGRKVTDWTVDKMVEFTVLNANGRAVGSFYIMSSVDANQEATKAIPIDATGAYVLRISVKGPESTNFKLELGGDAIAAR